MAEESSPQTFCACARCKVELDEQAGEGVRGEDGQWYCSEACARGHDEGMRCPDENCSCHAAA